MHFKIEMNVIGMITLVMSIYKKYSAVLFEGVVHFKDKNF